MCDAAAQEAFLSANTFYCEKLKARITHKQCELNRALPELHQDIPMEQWRAWRGTPIGKALAAGIRKPIRCAGCGGPKEDKGMGKYPEGVCSKCGETRRIIGRKLCSKCYFQERKEGKKNGTWVHPAPKLRENIKKAAGIEIKAPESAKPAANIPEIIPENTALPKPTTSPDQPDLSTVALPGDLYIVAKIPLEQIRVMTVEQLREMCRAGHC